MHLKQHHVKLPFLGGPDGLDGEREPGGEEPVARALHREEVDPGRGGHPQVRDERDEVVRDRDGLAPGQSGKMFRPFEKWLAMCTLSMTHVGQRIWDTIRSMWRGLRGVCPLLCTLDMIDRTWDLSMTFLSPALDVVDGAADIDPPAAPLVALLLGVPGGAGHVVAAVPAARVVAEHVRVVAARVRLLQALIDVLKEGKKFDPQCHAKLIQTTCLARPLVGGQQVALRTGAPVGARRVLAVAQADPLVLGAFVNILQLVQIKLIISSGKFPNLASPAVGRLLEPRLAVATVRAPDVGATLLADSPEVQFQNLWSKNEFKSN